MNDLWRRCLGRIRSELPAAEWHRCFAPLRAWFEAGELYLWVGRRFGDWRHVPVEAREYDRLIRRAFEELWGRRPLAIHYLEAPPKRERIVNRRRLRDHRERKRLKEARELRAFHYYQEQARTELGENPPPIPANCTDVGRYYLTKIDSRAKLLLEKHGIPEAIAMKRRSHGQRQAAPRAPTTSAQRCHPGSERARGATAPPPPRSRDRDAERPRSEAERQCVGPAEVRAAMRELGWLEED